MEVTRPPAVNLTPFVWSRSTAAPLDLGGGPSSTIAGLAVLPRMLSPTAVSPPSPGWIAAGTRTSANGATSATVWSSPDAKSWIPSSLDAAAPYSRATAVAQWGSRTVVVGEAGDGTNSQPAVWVSQGAGLPFEAVIGKDLPIAPGSAGMDVVGAGGLGVFAVGHIGDQLAIWYSTDGSHWSRLADAERAVSAQPGASIRTVAVTAHGVFMAGTITSLAGVDAGLWSSADGVAWSRVSSADASFAGGDGHLIEGLASLNNGLVAVGAVRSSTGQWSPASWISPDGA
ncbi:MAG: hypothetical protein ACR2KC_06050, partial [Acidimicrobiales bacterium]